MGIGYARRSLARDPVHRRATRRTARRLDTEWPSRRGHCWCSIGDERPTALVRRLRDRTAQNHRLGGGPKGGVQRRNFGVNYPRHERSHNWRRRRDLDLGELTRDRGWLEIRGTPVLGLD